MIILFQKCPTKQKHNRSNQLVCIYLLTVRNTDASSRMTEYTSPLLFMETCEGRRESVTDHLKEIKTQNLIHRHVRPKHKQKKKVL